LNEKWKCDICGYEENTQNRYNIPFATHNNDTENMYPNCFINYLKEHIPQLRKVNNND